MMQPFSQFSRLMFWFLAIFPWVYAFSAEENFLLVNGLSGEIVCEQGPHVDQRITPCSTFKIVLSLMGYDAEILEDEYNPIWPFQEGYDDYFERWKAPHSPQLWMKHSCLWYSKCLATLLGLENIQNYLVSMDYGNQDMSGGLTTAWVSSSLKISPREQVKFLQSLVKGTLPVSSHALEMTKALLFVESLPDGWALYGKTGSGSLPNEHDSQPLEMGWFVGWIEKNQAFFPFAYNIRHDKVDPSQRILRVKQLLVESGVTSNHCRF